MKNEKLALKKKELTKVLMQYRLNAGFKNTFEVSRELGCGRATIYKYENGSSVPSNMMLTSLMNLYKLNERDREYLYEVREEIIKLEKGK